MNSLQDQDSDSDSLIGKDLLGVVVDNNDPMQLERVRCSINGLFSGTPEELPWIAPKRLGLYPNTKNGSSGTFALPPPVGTQLLVTFQGGNPLYPNYEAYPVQSSERPSLGSTNYLYRYGHVDPDGTTFFVDTKPGAEPKMEFVHTTGLKITISSTGKLTIIAPSGVDVNVTGDTNITTTGKAVVSAGGDTKVSAGGNASLNAGGNATISAGGTVNISGSSVSVSGSGPVTIGGSGSIAITGSSISLN